MSELTGGTEVPKTFRSLVGHAVAAVAITVTIFAPQVAFFTSNTVTSSLWDQDTLDLDSVVQIFGHQVPTYGIAGTVLNGGGPVAPYGSPAANYEFAKAQVTTGGSSPNVGDETFVFTDRFTGSTAADLDRMSSGPNTNLANLYSGNCETHLDNNGNQAPPAMVGSLGIPTLKGQKSGSGVFKTADATPVPQETLTTRNMLAIDGCAKMDLQDESIGHDGHGTMTLSSSNGVKHGFKVAAYLTDYHPYATFLEDRLSVRCLALEPMDTTVAQTCSIFRTETEIKEGLAAAETQRAGKQAAVDALADPAAQEDIDAQDPYDDRNRLKVGNLKGAANRAKNCPIICDPRDESDYIEDRAEMPFGKHVVKARGTDTRKCIAGIDASIEETLNQDEFSETNIIASIIRSKPLADTVSKDIGVSNQWAMAGYGIVCAFGLISFFGLFFFSASPDKKNIMWMRGFLIIFIIVSFVVWIVVTDDIERYASDYESTSINNVDGCFDSLQSSADNSMSAMAIPGIVLPLFAAMPYVGLLFFTIPWALMWCAAYFVLPTGQNEFFNLRKWSLMDTYALNLAAGEPSDATDRVGRPTYEGTKQQLTG